MTKQSTSELSKNASMTIDDAMQLLAQIDPKTLPRNTVMLLSDIMPISTWRNLTQSQKGFIGQVFYAYCEQLGFEYAGKGVCGTTNSYCLIADKDKKEA